MAKYIHPLLEHPSDIRLVTILPRAGSQRYRNLVSLPGFDPVSLELSSQFLRTILTKDFESKAEWKAEWEDITNDDNDDGDDESGTDLSIRISVERLDDTLKYSALSYVWGKGAQAKPSIPIHVCGPNSGTIEITPSLHTALCHFRGNSPKYLWIDGLCINQTDTAEKNHQVKRMSEIYSKAEKVLIWLGPEEKKSDLAMSLIRELPVGDIDNFVKDKDRGEDWIALAELMRREWFTRRWILQEVALARRAELWCGNSYVSWEKFDIAVSLFESQLNSINELFRALKRKEKRMNTVKSVAMDSSAAVGVIGLATLAIVGMGAFHVKAPPGLMVAAANASRSLESSVKSGYNEFCSSLQTNDWQEDVFLGQVRGVGAHSLVTHLHRIMSKNQVGNTIQKLCTTEELLSYLPTFQATHPQDVIFCITSLAKDSLDIEPDYGETHEEISKKTIAVCREAIEVIVGRSKSLNIICRAWANVDDSAPSWIPRLTRFPFYSNDNRPYDRVNADILVGSPERHIYHASQTLPAEVVFTYDKEHCTLITDGIRIGYTVELAEPATNGVIPRSWVELFGSKSTSFEETTQEPFWQTLVAGRDCQGDIPPSWMGQVCSELYAHTKTLDTVRLLELSPTKSGPITNSKKAFRKTFNFSSSSSPSTSLEELSSTTRIFLERVQAVTWNRRIGRLENGLLALLPEQFEEGDLIVVLLGCDVPVVLRAVDNREWIMIGEAYIHGIMDGESLDQSWEREAFEIR